MSWIDRISTEMTITTGDGKSFVPQWLNASKAVDYNVAQFVFKELAGTLVKRGTPMGTRYAIEIYFQGEDHLDLSAEFDKSAADPKPWTISHPFYGSILVQPIGLVYDNSSYNLTKITGGIIETISETPDKPVVSAADKVIADKELTDAAYDDAYLVNNPAPKAADLQDMLGNAAGAYAAALADIRNTGDAQDFINAYNKAQGLITAATLDTVNTLAALRSFYSMPLNFADTVANRIAMLGNMLSYLHSTVANDMSRTAKCLYELNAGVVVSSIIAAAVTNTTGAYGSRKIALSTIDSLLASYNAYLANLDALQTLTGGLVSSYIPSRVPISSLSRLVGYAVNELLGIAAASRQERSFYLEEESNLILLTHRLYGMSEDDSTMVELMEQNEIGVNEMLSIRKGRLITYYV